MTTFWDFLPTACEVAGIKAPKDIQGISYLPTLLGKKQRKTHDYVYYEFYEQGGKQSMLSVRDGWKLVRLNMDTPKKIKEELYNINEDIAEENDLIAKYPQKADELRKLMESYRTESEMFNWKNKE